MIQKDMISFSGQRNEPLQTYMEKFVLPECKKGKIRFFDDAQRVFIFCTDKQMQIDVAAANEDLLCDISVKKLLWLAENFRIWRDEYCAYNQVLNRDQMERLLTLEPTGYGQMLLILGIFKQHGYDRLQSEQYLRAKSAVVRYHTLVFRYEQEHSKWDGLDAMLLDPSRRVRDYAAYILKKHTDINIITFYREERERQASKITLYSIGEHGTKAELEVIKPYLADECESICKAALHAYGKLAQSDGKDVYWKFLFDKRQVLARQAYRCIRKYEISYGVQQLYEAYLQKRLDFPADYLLMLLLEEPFWKRLPYLLMLNCDEKVTEKQRQIITAGIFRGYLYSGTSDQQTVNYMYSSVTNQQADMIRHLLERNKEHIPESVRKKILFDLEHISKG